jgi:hypothetical protein
MKRNKIRAEKWEPLFNKVAAVDSQAEKLALAALSA